MPSLETPKNQLCTFGFFFAGRITSIAHILALPKEELATKAKISADDVTELLDTISKKLSTTGPCSVLDMWNNTCDENLLVSNSESLNLEATLWDKMDDMNVD